ncbi:hypothetical protein BYT27DRAFT_6688563 [Phlegmacium glaucopus]|nr:hypothetical protein BYT27DRAFT_6688563 [Phlegmacium glaucopus]
MERFSRDYILYPTPITEEIMGSYRPVNRKGMNSERPSIKVKLFFFPPISSSKPLREPQYSIILILILWVIPVIQFNYKARKLCMMLARLFVSIEIRIGWGVGKANRSE